MFDSPVPSSMRHASAVLLALSAAVITACGGGGDAAVTASTSGATERATAYAAGPITGFGSVIVNGVRYDDSKAMVTDDDDHAHSRDRLKLGMMVEIDGAGLDHAIGLGRALHIRFGSEIVGPVTAPYDEGTGTLGILGQTVEVKDTTVIDDGLIGGVAPLALGDVLEVHAQFNVSSGHYVATRIEGAAGATTYKLRGLVAKLAPDAKTFELGGLLIDYSKVSDLPQNLADGLRVRVRLDPNHAEGAPWIAISVHTGVRKVEDHEGADVRGAITVFRSSTDFEINGLTVNAATAAFPDGTAGLQQGAMVEVEGAIVDGVLVATKVELEVNHMMARRVFELHGMASDVDLVAKTFKLRGITVGYDDSVTWNGVTAADLTGKKVEVKGSLSLDRTMLRATSIKLDT